MSNKEIFYKSVIAGMFICISSYSYLLINNYYGRLIGAIIFPLGLYFICTLKLNLFTGKIGFLINSNKNNFSNNHNPIIYLLIILFGNIIGALSTGLLLGMNEEIQEYSKLILLNKLSENYILDLLGVFIRSLLCGILVHCTIILYGKNKNPASIFAPIALFVVCGFDHCIAMFSYLGISQNFDYRILILILISIVGNSVGSMFFEKGINFYLKNKNQQ